MMSHLCASVKASVEDCCASLLSRPLYLSSALVQTAPTTLCTAWTAPQFIFSEPSVTSSPLYSAPMRTPLSPLSIGSLGGHYHSRFYAPLRNSLFLPSDKARQQQHTVVPRSEPVGEWLPNPGVPPKGQYCFNLSLPTFSLPPTATRAAGIITLPPAATHIAWDNHSTSPRLTPHFDDSPPGRSWHTLNFISPTRAVVYGGLDQTNSILSDCWVLEVPSLRWIQLVHQRCVPRLWHRAQFVGANRLLIVGGHKNNILDMRINKRIEGSACHLLRHISGEGHSHRAIGNGHPKFKVGPGGFLLLGATSLAIVSLNINEEFVQSPDRSLRVLRITIHSTWNLRGVQLVGHSSTLPLPQNFTPNPPHGDEGIHSPGIQIQHTYTHEFILQNTDPNSSHFTQPPFTDQDHAEDMVVIHFSPDPLLSRSWSVYIFPNSAQNCFRFRSPACWSFELLSFRHVSSPMRNHFKSCLGLHLDFHGMWKQLGYMTGTGSVQIKAGGVADWKEGREAIGGHVRFYKELDRASMDGEEDLPKAETIRSVWIPEVNQVKRIISRTILSFAATECLRALVDTITKYEIPYENVLGRLYRYIVEGRDTAMSLVGRA
uniref:Uncharacterized protein n=1 Tax=Timema shepardi TaxID=629360 RepID=A0A7R9FVM6_TIMSH|nr:unnamed protein product [Timema shepardi]